MNLIQCLAHTSRRVTKEEMQLVKEHVEFLAIKERAEATVFQMHSR